MGLFHMYLWVGIAVVLALKMFISGYAGVRPIKCIETEPGPLVF